MSSPSKDENTLPRALITGSSRGIGAAVAETLAAAGHPVIINYRSRADAAEEVAERIRAAGGEAVLSAFDVGDAEATGAALSALLEDPRPIGVVVNNAGITRDGMFHKMTPQQWKEVIDTNLTGIFNMTHPLWTGMRERGFGRVVNISSINGQKGQMGQANYSAAKAGDLGFTKALAQEGAFKGVTVNAICPGYIGTDMVMAVPEKVRESIVAQIPVGRLGTPEEIARCVVFLASDDAGFITGSTITANGGQFVV